MSDLHDKDFAHLLAEFMTRAERSVRWLSQRTGIPQRTIENWLARKVARGPRNVRDVLKLAREFQLTEQDTNKLLQAAGKPVIDKLRQVGDKELDDLLVFTPRATQLVYQLRGASNDFVGRQREIAELEEALCKPHSGGSVTIIRAAERASVSGVRGMGGIGKTELALMVANRLTGAFSDGQIIVALQGSREEAALTPTQALQAIVRAFLPDEKLPDEEHKLTVLYRTLLTGKHVLILADDAKGAEQIRLLAPPAGSALLITSRQRFTLPGMVAIDLDKLSDHETVALLQKICVRITRPEAQEIARMCGNLPLALVISAGILANDDQLATAHYIQMLSDERQRLAKLRDPDDSNLDVEASLNLSYATLNEQAQQALAQLGVFAPSFDRAAARAILSLPEGADSEEVLGLLRRRGLLDYDSAHDRYSLHELIRVFALMHLAEAGQEHAIRLEHAGYYIQVTAKADRQFHKGGTGVTAGLALFDREQAQLDMARAWLQRNAGDPDIDILLIADAGATTHIGALRYEMRDERIPQIEAALAAARRCDARGAQSALLGFLGDAFATLGDGHKAIAFYEQSLRIARETGDDQGVRSTLGNLGNAHYVLGDIQTAIKYHNQALAINREIGDRRGEAATLGNLGNVFAALGDPHKAIAFYEQSLRIVRETGDRQSEANTLSNLGNALASLGDTHKAIKYHNQALAINHEIGDRRSEAATLGNLGNVFAALGDPHKAIAFYQRRLTLAREIGDHKGQADASWNYGLALVHQNELTQGMPLLEASLAFYQAMDHPRAATMAIILDEIRQSEAVAAPSEASNVLDGLPDAVRQAIEKEDNQALQSALDALPPQEAAVIVERLERANIIEAQRRTDTVEILRMFETLLRDIARVAVGDVQMKPQVEAALTRLDAGEWQLAAPVHRIWSGERDPEKLVEGLDEQDKALVERILELVYAYTHGERNTPAEVLTALPEALRYTLDEQDKVIFKQALAELPEGERGYVLEQLAQLIEDTLSLVASTEPEVTLSSLPEAMGALLEESPEELRAALNELPANERQPTVEIVAMLQREALTNVPATLREAIEQHNQQAFEVAFAALPTEDAAAIVKQLKRVGIIGEQYGPDMEQTIQKFLPVLGDIALAAYGDEVARSLAEAILPIIEANGWRLNEAVRRIWDGERNEASLIATLDPYSTQLVRKVLSLIATGPEMLFVAGSIQIATLRRQADDAMTKVLDSGDTTERASLAEHFEELARQVEEEPGEPWLDLAAKFRALAVQLNAIK